MTERRTLSPELEEEAQALIKDMMLLTAEAQAQVRVLAELGTRFTQSIEGSDVCDIMKPALDLQRISKDTVRCANRYWEIFDLDTVDGWDYDPKEARQ